MIAIISIIGANMMANANAANLPSTSANTLMNQQGNAMAQQNAANIGMGPNQIGNVAQRLQTQNSSMLINQGMNAGNMSTLQQMKQNQQQMAGNNMFAAGAGMAQQRQVCHANFSNDFDAIYCENFPFWRRKKY